MADQITWNIELPERSATALGQRKPRAVLGIASETHGQESFSIPLAVGKKLDKMQEGEEQLPQSRAELLYALSAVGEGCAWERIVALVDKRDYARSELESKLKLDGYTQKTIDVVLARAEDSWLVDDARFAKVFIASKLSCGWGKLRIERELALKGIDVQAVEGWPEAFFGGEGEYERAYQLASKRRLTGKNDFQKIVRFLAGKGYSYSVATAVASALLTEEE